MEGEKEVEEEEQQQQASSRGGPEMDRKQAKYTTIEGVFKSELWFIKICGGFMFETGSFIEILYRLSIIIVARFLNVRHYSKFPREFEVFSKAAWQNVRLFWFSYQLISHATVFVTLLTGIKYHNLVSVILKKRLDIRYLAPKDEDEAEGAKVKAEVGAEAEAEGSSFEQPGACMRPREGSDIPHSRGASTITSFITSTESTSGNGGSRAPMEGSYNGNNNNYNNDTNNHHAKSRNLKVKMVRNFLIGNVLLTTLSSFLRDQTYARFQFAQPQNSTSLTPPVALSQPIPNLTSPSIIRDLEQQQPPLPPPPRSNLSTTNRPTIATTVQSRHLLHRFHPFYQFNSTNWIKRLGLSSLVGANFLPPMVAQTILVMGYILFAFLEAALNISQTYGQLFVVLMVTATITDMLSYSCAHGGLISRGPLDQMNNNNNNNHDKYKIEAPQIDTKKQFSPSSRRPSLTTELLIQARDVLIVLRCTMGLDYLMVLIFELARLMSGFCMLNAAITTGRIDAIILICIDYISIASSMSLTRLGYHWLHDQVRELKRAVDERNLLPNNDKNTVINSTYGNSNISASTIDEEPSNYNTTGMSQSERITTYRLADHIEGLWPTDWFTPDLKGYLKHNIFVITFVATLQQLVEAGSRFHYQPNNQSETETIQLGS